MTGVESNSFHMPFQTSTTTGGCYIALITVKTERDLNVRRETIKLLEENIGRTLSDINHSKILYDPPPRVMEIKTPINKRDQI